MVAGSAASSEFATADTPTDGDTSVISEPISNNEVTFTDTRYIEQIAFNAATDIQGRVNLTERDPPNRNGSVADAIQTEFVDADDEVTGFTLAASIDIRRAPALGDGETATLRGSVPAQAIDDPSSLTVIRVPDNLSSAETLPTDVTDASGGENDTVGFEATTTNFSTFVVGETQTSTGEFAVDINGTQTDDSVEPGTTATVVASVTNTRDSQATQTVTLDFGENTSTDSVELTLNGSESTTVILTHDVAVDAPLGSPNATVRTANDSDSTEISIIRPDDGEDDAAPSEVNVTASSVSPISVTSSTQETFEVAVRIDNTSLGDTASGDITVAFEGFNLSVDDDELAGPEEELRIDYTDANVSNGTISVTEVVSATAPSTTGGYPVYVTDVEVATGSDTDEFLIEDELVTMDTIEVTDGPDDGAGLPENGTEDDLYRIANVSELQAMEDDLNGHYVLVADIDATDTAQWNNGSGFDPVGGTLFNNDLPWFRGTLDGNGHTIAGLTIDRPSEDFVGIFRTSAGTISNVSLTNVTVTGNSRTGVVAAANPGDVSDTSVSGNVTGDRYVGGVVGDNPGSITNATASVTVSGGQDVGGLVGGSDGTITAATASGSVNGTGVVGGLTGSNQGAISDANASGSVTGSEFGDVGGLVGRNAGTITAATASGNVTGIGDSGNSIGGLVGGNTGTITNTAASGRVSGSSNVGGLVGKNDGGGNRDGGTIRESFAVGLVSGENGVGGLAGSNIAYDGTTGSIFESYFDSRTTNQPPSENVTSLTTAQMQGEAARTNMTGLDFETTWRVTDGYPALRAFSETAPGEGPPDAGTALTVNASASSVSPTTAIVGDSQTYTVTVTVENTSLNESEARNIEVRFEDFEFDTGEDDLTIGYSAADVTDSTVTVSETVSATPVSTGLHDVTVTDIRREAIDEETGSLLENANVTIDTIEVIDTPDAPPEAEGISFVPAAGSSSFGRNDSRVYAEKIVVATPSSGGVSIGDANSRAFRLVQTDTDTNESVVVEPEPGVGTYNITGAAFEIYQPNGTIGYSNPLADRGPALRVELANGTRTEIPVTVSGNRDLFDPSRTESSVFDPYAVQLLSENTTQPSDSSVLAETGSRIRGIGYDGGPGTEQGLRQNSTEGTIEASIDRESDVNASWDVEYVVASSPDSLIEYAVTPASNSAILNRSVDNDNAADNFTATFDSGGLQNGSYLHAFVIRPSERSDEVYLTLIGENLRIGDAGDGPDDGGDLVPFPETDQPGQTTPPSLAGKFRVEESVAASTTIALLENSSTEYSLNITAPDGSENVTFYLQEQAVSASQDIDDVRMLLDGQPRQFTVVEDAGPGNSSWIAFTVPHFSTRTVTFTSESGSGDAAPSVTAPGNATYDPSSSLTIGTSHNATGVIDDSDVAIRMVNVTAGNNTQVALNDSVPVEGRANTTIPADRLSGDVTIETQLYNVSSKSVVETDVVSFSSTIQSTLTVNNSDPDTYDSIQAAVDAAAPETTIIVHPGEYNESVQIYRNVSIVSESVYAADPRPNTGAPAPAPVLDSNRTSYAAFNIHHDITGIRIEGFEIRNYTNGIRAWNNGTTAITVRQNTIRQVDTGVLVGGDPTIDDIGTGQHRYWNISSNDIQNATDSGMQVYNLANATVRSNQIYRSAEVSGGNNFSFGISTTANNETVTNVTVRNNSLTGTYDNFGIGVRAGFPQFDSSGALTDVEIVDNRVEASLPGDGISISAYNDSHATNIQVVNNTVSDATTDWPGVGVFTMDNGQMGSLTVRNNTLLGNKHGFGIAMATNTSYDTVRLLNNDISQNERNGVIITSNTSGDGLILRENTITSNQNAGLLHNGTGQVNATRNWWGATDGPSGNFTGSGQKVFGNVTVQPFYTDANLTTLSSEQDDGSNGDDDNSTDSGAAPSITAPGDATYDPNSPLTIETSHNATGVIDDSDVTIQMVNITAGNDTQVALNDSVPVEGRANTTIPAGSLTGNVTVETQLYNVSSGTVVASDTVSLTADTSDDGGGGGSGGGGGGGDDSDDPSEPAVTAVITANQTGVYPDEVIMFNGSASEGTNLAYEWTFGDGTSATDESVTHAYNATGTYNVTLTAANQSASDTDQIAVRVVEPVTATLTAERTSASVGDIIEFDALASTSDNRTANVTYEWQFGDGDTVTDTVVAHEYNATGTYTVTLTATDTVTGETTTDTVEVTVEEGTDNEVPGFGHIASLLALLLFVLGVRRKSG